MLELAPEATHIRFSLAATMHTVEGTLQLREGTLDFDEGAGTASGRIVIDARSAATGNRTRDAKMHGEVLETERYPEIVFTPSRLELRRSTATRGDVRLVGRVQIHGDEHPLTIPARIERDGDELHLEATFHVPYVEWGMRDVSNWVLRVAPVVDVHLDAKALYRPAP